MRLPRLIRCFILLIGLSAFAQEAPLPKPDTQDGPITTPAPSPITSPSPAPELIPADLLSASERAAAAPVPTSPANQTISQLDEGFKSTANASAESTLRHAEWRQLQNRVMHDVAVKTALRRAEAAGTDLVKRRLLRDYYEIFFSKMIALASSPAATAYLIAKKNEQLSALSQPRVRPPSPTPAKPSS